MTQRFAGKIALVTAGGSGIGQATCEAFARAGAVVMVADIDGDNAAKVAERLRGEGADAHSCRADVTVEADAERLVDSTVKRLGGLHIAANVVGLMHAEAGGPLLHLNSATGWDATLAGSLRSTFLCCKYEIAHMIAHGGGSIVNVASVGGSRYIPESGTAYAAAKAAVIQFTRFAAIGYAEHGIRVNSVAPGVTITPAFPAAAEVAYPDLRPDEALEKFIATVVARHAIKRATTPSDQANAILWLCSEEAAMVTGHILAVDGGFNAY